MVPPHAITFRLRGCPGAITEVALCRKLSKSLGDIAPSEIRIYSLATTLHPWETPKTKTATLSFAILPSVIKTQLEKEEWVIEDDETLLILDNHFFGFTPLSEIEAQEHEFECIAISGLGAHPFGSWRPKGDHGGWMWIRDALPIDLASVRTVLFGYNTTSYSMSFQSMADLASSFIASVKAADLAAKPLIFLAHSLGGTVLQEAIVALADGDDQDRHILQQIIGAVLFGVPSRGIETPALLNMDRGEPLTGLIRNLSTKSEYLHSLSDLFFSIATLEGMTIFWGYETRDRAQMTVNGTIDVDLPPHLLVTASSATRGLHGTGSRSIFAIDETHSDMIKFRPGDKNYAVVISKLIEICNARTKAVSTGFQAQSVSSDGYRALYSRRTTAAPLLSRSPSPSPTTQFSTSSAGTKRITGSFRVRLCYIIYSLALLLVVGSASLGIYWTIAFDKMGDGFTAAGWIVAIGTMALAGPVAHHYPNCNCWKRVSPYFQENHSEAP